MSIDEEHIYGASEKTPGSLQRYGNVSFTNLLLSQELGRNAVEELICPNVFGLPKPAQEGASSSNQTVGSCSHECSHYEEESSNYGSDSCEEISLADSSWLDKTLAINNKGLADEVITGHVLCEGDTVRSFQSGPKQVLPPGVKKRRRTSKGDQLPDRRPSRKIGAVAMAIKNAHCRSTKYIFEPSIGTVFDSIAEAYEFCNLYSWEVGFGIRLGRSSINRVNKYQTKQEFECQRAKLNKRAGKNSFGSKCNALNRLHRTDDEGWYVSDLRTEHNHPLSASYGEKKEWNSHKIIDEPTKEMIRHLRENNIPLGKVHSIMGSMHGSMECVPFTKRALRSVCDKITREKLDDDVLKTLDIFKTMKAADPDFQFSVQLDSEDNIKTLIWSNGRGRRQYHWFGEVLVFDTTYCTNKYRMPFGLFVGVNNHFQTIIYAGVLMRSETTESFKWVFDKFLLLMCGKTPVTVLTELIAS